jgi:hypothetical protein
MRFGQLWDPKMLWISGRMKSSDYGLSVFPVMHLIVTSAAYSTGISLRDYGVAIPNYRKSLKSVSGINLGLISFATFKLHVENAIIH